MKIKLIILNLILLINITSCNGQDKDKNTLTNEPNFIGKELIIDKISSKENKFQSETLDKLFNKKNYTYLIGEYSGTSKENFDCKIIGLFSNNKYEKSYAIFSDKNEILRDTLNITNKDISLNVLFGNNKRGIALGKVDTTNFKRIINEIYTMLIIFNTI